MLTTIIRGVIRFKAMILFLVIIATLFSLYFIRSAPLDAIPDIADAQVVLYVKWDRSPELIENEVAKPVIQGLLGSPGIKSVRATSSLGFSFIYIVLEDENRREAIRQLVLDKINAIRHQLPEDANIKLAPNASSMGWFYQYALVDKNKTHDLRELRLLNESFIKTKLQAITGIAEVATVGGLERKVVLKIFPPLLEQAGITLHKIESSLKTLFQQVGGRTIELTNRDYHLRATADIEDLNSIEHLVVSRSTDGQVTLLKDIGYLQVDYDIRRGIADLDGAGEVVGAIVIMEQEKNVISVSERLKEKLQEIQSELPDGIVIVTTYDRSSLIWATLKNFSTALIYELLVVTLVIIWALRNGRAAVAPVIIILLGCLYTVMSLSFIGQTINLLSLAGLAIAIGEMADATIVIVENCTTELVRKGKNTALTYGEKLEIIIVSISRMMRPLLFSL
ncbi:MAG TPA: efflux RND transporter permease subunit, partial [Gammaproteobacteria bacterium]|nr:efflux RND transporter permease subunit [Gammaproteobacteria bacterium]